ncbi:bacteriocin [Pseudoalteromonas xiamenensis]
MLSIDNKELSAISGGHPAQTEIDNLIEVLRNFF